MVSASTLLVDEGVKRSSRAHQEQTPVAVIQSDSVGSPAVTVPGSGVDLEALERALIVFALENAAGNRTRAARFLGLTRSALLYRMHKYGLFAAAGAARSARTSTSVVSAARPEHVSS